MPAIISPPTLFPPLTRSSILAFQFSSWYPRFSHVSIKSRVIKPLGRDFVDYLNADGVFVPEGSEDVEVRSGIEEDENSGIEDEDDEDRIKYAFPELDQSIREIVKKYGAVFPKVNFSSPKDASWLLPSSSPLKCTSPADVYMLLKSSDFVAHDLDEANVFEGCESEDEGEDGVKYELELVLRKWYPMEKSRELRCFVRRDVLIGISQRDTNYYDFLNDASTGERIRDSVQQFWESNIRGKWPLGSDYVFDILLTRDLSSAHIMDFNPYAPRTDSLLFVYEDLLDLLVKNDRDALPEFRVVDSPSHPAATRNAPEHQHNMMPFEALSLSSGMDVEAFERKWREEVAKATEAEEGA